MPDCMSAMKKLSAKSGQMREAEGRDIIETLDAICRSKSVSHSRLARRRDDRPTGAGADRKVTCADRVGSSHLRYEGSDVTSCIRSHFWITAMPLWTCETCGAQFAESGHPPASCPICEDERQYVNW